MILPDRLIERCNFLHCLARIESLSRDRLACCVHSRNEKQIVHDSGKSFAFTDGGFDSLAVLGRRALTREGNLCFAHHICDGRSQLVREIGGKLREPSKGIVEPLKHVVEGESQRLKLARPARRGDSLLQMCRVNTSERSRHLFRSEER